MIRRATPDDIPALVEMGGRFHAMSPWADVEFAAEVADASLRGMLQTPTMALFVADDGEVRGALGVMVAPVYFANAFLAQEAFWWCEAPRDALGLLKAAEAWSAQHGAVRMVMVRIEGVRADALDKLYRRLGYAPAEHHYVKGL